MLNQKMVFGHFHKLELTLKAINKRGDDNIKKASDDILDIIKNDINPGIYCKCGYRDILLEKCEDILDKISYMESLEKSTYVDKLLDDCTRYIEMIKMES